MPAEDRYALLLGLLLGTLAHPGGQEVSLGRVPGKFLGLAVGAGCFFHTAQPSQQVRLDRGR
jgi:hypothetical protein